MTTLIVIGLALFPLSSALGGLVLLGGLFWGRPNLKASHTQLFTPLHTRLMGGFALYSLLQLIWVKLPLHHLAGFLSHYVLLWLLLLGFYGLLAQGLITKHELLRGIWGGAVLLSFIGINAYSSHWDVHLQWFQIPAYDRPYLLDFKLSGCDKACGFAMNSNVLGSIVTLGLLLSPKVPVHFLLRELGQMVLFGGVFLSFSRGAWLGVVIGGAFIVLKLYQKKEISKKELLQKLAAVGLVFALTKKGQQELRLLFQAQYRPNALRLETWSGALHMLWEHPGGIGILHYEHWAHLYSATPLPHAHNLYLQTALESGVVGAVLLFALLVVWLPWKTPAPFLKGALLAFAAFSCVDYTFVDLRVALPVLLLFLLWKWEAQQAPETDKIPS